MNCKDILERAVELTGGDRNEQHGDKLVNHLNIADMWSTYLRISRELAIELSPKDAAIMMALLKIARTTTGNHNDDDYVDACGYLAIAGEVVSSSDKQKEWLKGQGDETD